MSTRPPCPDHRVGSYPIRHYPSNLAKKISLYNSEFRVYDRDTCVLKSPFEYLTHVIKDALYPI